ncbi:MULTISPECIES: head-tail connector protein [Xanthomonas]|uniref:head-tail connector protein n=1 Tax=Xanthomonas TaxID=338 RepID=UPI0005F2F09D|nr:MULTISPECIES: head-tail connector protein [Xanthomonas]
MPFHLVTPPAVDAFTGIAEPVSLAQVKLHLRVDVAEDDALILALISSARQMAETLTNRQLLSATWNLVLDAFPGPSLIGVPAGTTYSIPEHAILIAKGPVQAVTSIVYQDMNRNLVTLPPTDYVVTSTDDLTRITPIFGQTWQPTLPQIGAVNVQFLAGYADSTQVPEGIKHWIKLRVDSLYNQRGEVAFTRGNMSKLPYVDALLDPYRIVLL